MTIVNSERELKEFESTERYGFAERIVGYIDDCQTVGVGDRVECYKTHKKGFVEYIEIELYGYFKDKKSYQIWVKFDGEQNSSPCNHCYQTEQNGDLAL